jgi:hypothetical protein
MGIAIVALDDGGISGELEGFDNDRGAPGLAAVSFVSRLKGSLLSQG